MGMTVKGYRDSFMDNENILELESDDGYTLGIY